MAIQRTLKEMLEEKGIDSAEIYEALDNLVVHDAEVTEALGTLASYAVTARLHNQPEWMQGLAEEVNDACTALGDEDRFRFNGDELRRAVIVNLSE